MTPHTRILLSGALILAGLGSVADAQYSERRGLVGDITKGIDASGRSVKSERVKAVHTTDVSLLGGTKHLIEKDPYLAYRLGRDLNFREFEHVDGVFHVNEISPIVTAALGGPMPDGTTAKLTLQNHVSCVSCHNLPNTNPGGGMSIAKDSGRSRNTPHYYGAGIVEMIGLQTRLDLLAQVDTNDDGWVSVAEAQAGPASLSVAPTAGADPIDYGDPRLDGGATGSPSLNNVIRVWYVDASGAPVPGATSVDGVTTFGYGFDLIIWGWGQGAGRNALNPTNRAFLWDPYVTHFGLDAHDPTTLDDPDGDGVSVPSLAGAEQFPATHVPPDTGAEIGDGPGYGGYSDADPDGDFYWTELSEGDLDLAEWFMLNIPRPAFAGEPSHYASGAALMESLGCTSCHVPDWTLRAADGRVAGDRRLFDFAVTWQEVAPIGASAEGLVEQATFPGRPRSGLRGELIPLYDVVGGSFVPKRGAFEVEGVFSDFAHHDMGDGFAELGYDGVVNRVWRTPPLWGVGSGFPWGHDGASLTLEDAILRHDGEGAAARDAYVAASETQKRNLIDFLEALQLYDIESLPADIDGDGQIAEDFVVAGKNTGYERFNAEWLFATPAEIQGPVTNVDGQTIVSFAVVNLADAYAETLPYRIDSDGDSWPDVWDVAPAIKGNKNGMDN